MEADMLGECWEWKEPHEVEYWTLALVPMNKNVSFRTKYKKVKDNLPMTLTKVVREVTTGPNGLIFVCCKMADPDQKEEYLFSYVINSLKIIFLVSAYYKTLEGTDYQELQKKIELHLKQHR